MPPTTVSAAAPSRSSLLPTGQPSDSSPGAACVSASPVVLLEATRLAASGHYKTPDSGRPKGPSYLLAQDACDAAPQVLRVGPTFARGSAAKLREAYDAQDTLLAVRVVHTQPKSPIHGSWVATPIPCSRSDASATSCRVPAAPPAPCSCRRETQIDCSARDLEREHTAMQAACSQLLPLWYAQDEQNRIWAAQRHYSCDLFDSYLFLPRPKTGVAMLRCLTMDVLARLVPLHAAHWVHNDVKPENILLHVSGEAELGDYGMAMPCALLAEQPISCTPEYGAPELFAEAYAPDEFDAQARDMYALGISLLLALWQNEVQWIQYAAHKPHRWQQTLLQFHALVGSWPHAQAAALQTLTDTNANTLLRVYKRTLEIDKTLARFIFFGCLQYTPKSRCTAASAQRMFANAHNDTLEYIGRTQIKNIAQTVQSQGSRLQMRQRIAALPSKPPLTWWSDIFLRGTAVPAKVWTQLFGTNA